MTVIVVLAKSPQLGLILSGFVETSPLSEIEAADLYTAMSKDVHIAVGRSGGDLLVNYRVEDELLDEFTEDHDSEAGIRSVVTDALGGADNTRSEPQIGSTFSARVGSTVSRLLNEEEKVHSAVVVRPIAPLFGRTHLDSTAMKPRSTPVILGPLMEDRIYFPGFLDPIGFTGAYAEPEVETLARRVDDAGHGLDCIPMLPVLGTSADLATVVPMLRSRVEFERLVPEHTTTPVFEKRLWIKPADGVLEPIRG